jgi:hypothetical protein
MMTTGNHHNYAPLFDEREFTRKLVYDRQFIDLSERYDPIEATIDAHLEPCRLDTVEKICLAVAFFGASGMALAAWLA